jgi:DNA-binding LytR/AlgR family response regulator
MHSCRFEFEKNSRTIEIPQSGENILVSIADLLYVEVFDKESVFHLKRGKITTRLPLEIVETRLGGAPFLRCHRSYIVNMNYVDDMREEDFLMRNGSVVPIRKNGRKEVRMAMANYIAKSPLGVN